MDSVAERAPVALGLNTTVTVQLADAARVAPQVLDEMLKSLVLAPVKPMLLIVIEFALPFFNVAVCGALEEPTADRPEGQARRTQGYSAFRAGARYQRVPPFVDYSKRCR